MEREKLLGFLVTHWEVKSQKPFGFKDFYSLLHEWILDHDYTPSTRDTDFPEISYYESISQKGGKETWIKWRCNYVPEDNKFYRRILNIDIHGLGMKPMEIVQNNKKYLLDKGEVYISCQAILEIDWTGRWRKNWLLKHFLEIFYKRIVWKSMEKHKQEVHEDSHILNEFVKEYFEIQREGTKPTYYQKSTITEG